MQEKTGHLADIGGRAETKLTEVGRLQRRTIGQAKTLPEPDRKLRLGGRDRELRYE